VIVDSFISGRTEHLYPVRAFVPYVNAGTLFRLLTYKAIIVNSIRKASIFKYEVPYLLAIVRKASSISRLDCIIRIIRTSNNPAREEGSDISMLHKLSGGHDGYVHFVLFALNSAPTVYCDVRKPVNPNHSTFS
jgi:hypothetical protein